MNSRGWLGYQTVFGRIARLPLRLIPKWHVTTIRSGCNRGRRWIVGAGTHGMWLGTYEIDKQKLLSTIVKPGMIAWDVGAHAGFYTLAFSPLVGTTGRVCAFEPYAPNVARLLRHISLNRVPNAIVVQVALSARSEVVDFVEAPSSTMGKIRSGITHYGVPAISADEFVRENPDLTPDCLKIDVEGAEADVLEGAADLLKRVQPVIILALHGSSQVERCLTLLKSHGYMVRQLFGPSIDPELSRGEIMALPKSDSLSTAIADECVGSPLTPS